MTIFRFGPSFLIGAIGLWFAISRRKRHPRVSRFAMLGFSCLLLIVVFWFAVTLWMNYAEDQDVLRPGQLPEILVYFNLASNLVNLVALGAICAAVFIDREKLGAPD